VNEHELMALSVKDAKAAKWREGRLKYGEAGDHAAGKFVGDPVEHLYSELIDALNYADEAKRQGVEMPSVVIILEMLCREVKIVDIERRIVRMTTGRGDS